jgi:hypothetical protein
MRATHGAAGNSLEGDGTFTNATLNSIVTRVRVSYRSSDRHMSATLNLDASAINRVLPDVIRFTGTGCCRGCHHNSAACCRLDTMYFLEVVSKFLGLHKGQGNDLIT